MPIDLYVRSRGPEIEQDYKWVHVNEEQQKIEDPPLIERVGEIDRLIFSERFSLFLGRYRGDDGEKLILQVTGLSSQRTDYQPRRIRNTLACIGDGANSEDEMILRGIAVAALESRDALEKLVDRSRDDLEKLVDGSIMSVYDVDTSCSKEGYRVDGKRLRADLKTLKTRVELGTEEIAQGVGKNVPKLRRWVVEQLRSHQFPLQQNIVNIVVVTDFILEEVFSHNSVWLGLSDQIDQHLTEEQALLRRRYKVNPPKPPSRLDSHRNQPLPKPLSCLGDLKNLLPWFQDNAMFIIIPVIICFAAIIATYLWLQHQQP